MSQESLGFVKLEWTCPKCRTRNPGPEKTCAGCGAPQPQDVVFEQAERQELITDQKEIEKAKSGPDIHCPFCGTRNPAGAEVCSQCGGDLKEGARRETDKVVGAFHAGPAKQVACPNCGTMNAETNMRCVQCGAPLQRAPTPAAPVQPAAASKLPPWAIIVAALALVALCICAIVGYGMLSTPRESQNAQVQSVSWQTMVTIEALRPANHSDWEQDLPQDAQVGQCQDKVHHTQASEPAGQNFNKVCGTPYTVDKGSGFAEVVQDCEFEVLLPYCQYTVMEWQSIDQAIQSGNDLSPVWPDPQLAEGQRLGGESAKFVVIFDTGKEQIAYNVNSLDEFQQFQLGSEWVLNINSFGQVVSIEPVR